MKSICFVCDTIYPLLVQNDASGFIGGAELQQLLIGTELCKRGYEVTYITMDHGQGLISKAGQFRVIATFKLNEGVPVLRFFYPKLVKIWKALSLAKTDIYYVRCAGFVLSIVVLWARLKNKKVVFCGALDTDFDPNNLNLPTIRDEWMYLWGLKKCDKIVVQNKIQEKLLKDNFGIVGVRINNGLPKVELNLQQNNVILWVANIKRIKGPQHFLDLAAHFPNESFVMVGGRAFREEAFFDEIKSKAAKLPNVIFKGFLPIAETDKEFEKAKIFINTSSMEGFPNTFLQALRRGVPIISYVDPDNMIKDFRLGAVAKDYDELPSKLNEILFNGDKFTRERIKKYFDDHLTIDKQVDIYEDLFNSLKECEK